MEQALSVSGRERGNLSRWLFNPFHYLAGGPALGSGLGVILVSGLVAHLARGRFDGLIDFHGTAAQGPGVKVLLLDGIVYWILISLLLLTGGKLISRSRVRVLDVFGTQALARWPMFFTALAGLLPATRDINEILHPTLSTGFVAFVLLSVIGVLMLIWMIALMYRAFAVSFNVSGPKAATVFVVAMLLGEVLSKVYAYKII